MYTNELIKIVIITKIQHCPLKKLLHGEKNNPVLIEVVRLQKVSHYKYCYLRTTDKAISKDKITAIKLRIWKTLQ